MNEKVAVYISRELYERVKKEVEESGGEFKDVSEYIEFVLEELLKEEPPKFNWRAYLRNFVGGSY